MEESAQILEIETFIPLLLQVGNLLCITNAKYWVRYETSEANTWQENIWSHFLLC